MANGLVTSAQFPGLVPDIGGALAEGVALGQGLRNIQTQREQRQVQKEEQRRLSRARDIQGQVLQSLNPNDPRLVELAGISPKLFESTLNNIGLVDQAKRNEAANFAFDLQNTPTEQRIAKIQQRAQNLASQGRDNRDTLELLDIPPEQQDDILKAIQLGALTPQERLEFSAKAEKAADAGLSPVQSSEFLPGGGTRVVRKDGSVEVVQPTDDEVAIIRAGEERGVDLQQRRAKGRGIGAGTAKIANQALDSTEKLRSNNSKLRKVIAEVRGGADTGPLAKNLPSFRASTLRLKALQNELGLDVVGSVTFGALSEGELSLAMDTALPTGLQGPELIKWAQEKISAQEKLAEYLEDQAIFLSKQGNTAADWLELGRAKRMQRGEQQVATPSQVGRFAVEVVQ